MKFLRKAQAIVMDRKEYTMAVRNISIRFSVNANPLHWPSACLGDRYKQRFVLCYRTVDYPVYNVGVLWPNGWIDQDATWYGGRPRSGRHCVR